MILSKKRVFRHSQESGNCCLIVSLTQEQVQSRRRAGAHAKVLLEDISCIGFCTIGELVLGDTMHIVMGLMMFPKRRVVGC